MGIQSGTETGGTEDGFPGAGCVSLVQVGLDDGSQVRCKPRGAEREAQRMGLHTVPL